MRAGAQWQVALLYLPCLLMVLRRRNMWITEHDGVRRLLSGVRQALRGSPVPRNCSNLANC
jgi:hypothetical protein